MRLKIGIIALLMFCISACGFRPLYWQSEEDSSRSASVLIDPISGEGGYQMGLILKEKLNPKDIQVSKEYQLSVVLGTPQYTNQSIRSDNFATLERMDIDITYKLKRLSDEKILISSSLNSSGVYNLIDSPYATTIAKDNLYENLLKAMAEDIAVHVLSYLKGETP